MIPLAPLPFLETYLSRLRQIIGDYGHRLTRIQSDVLAFMLLAMLESQSLCWARFARLSQGRWTDKGLCDMFYRGIDCWPELLNASTHSVITRFGLTKGVLAVDDTDNPRSKRTKHIWHAHKALDKATGGFHNAQNLVILLLVTPCCTIPVGFQFYQPDPKQQAWRLLDDELKARGVSKSERPPQPDADPEYPTREQVAVSLVKTFQEKFPSIEVTSILYDSAYNSPYTMSEFGKISPGAQKITQIRSNQIVETDDEKKCSVEDLFKQKHFQSITIKLRGHREQTVRVCTAHAKVKSHDKKYRIVALAYEGEKDPRYIICSDPSWQTKTIVEYYSCRWLVETFIEDWKQHEGWARQAYQQGEQGSLRGVILSFLLDHSLLFQAEQAGRFDRQLPALSVGTLRAIITNEATVAAIEEIINHCDPKFALDNYRRSLEKTRLNNASTKHFSGRPFFKIRKRKGDRNPIPPLQQSMECAQLAA